MPLFLLLRPLHPLSLRQFRKQLFLKLSQVLPKQLSPALPLLPAILAKLFLQQRLPKLLILLLKPFLALLR